MALCLPASLRGQPSSHRLLKRCGRIIEAETLRGAAEDQCGRRLTATVIDQSAFELPSSCGHRAWSLRMLFADSRDRAALCQRVICFCPVVVPRVTEKVDSAIQRRVDRGTACWSLRVALPTWDPPSAIAKTSTPVCAQLAIEHLAAQRARARHPWKVGCITPVRCSEKLLRRAETGVADSPHSQKKPAATQTILWRYSLPQWRHSGRTPTPASCFQGSSSNVVRRSP